MKVLSNKETNMPHKTTAALAAVLFFGGASVVWADDNSQINGSFAQQPVAIVSNGRTAVNQAAKAFPTEEEPLLAPSQRDGTTGRTTAWVRLTEPGGKPIHINVEHVTSVRADTQISGLGLNSI
jgi:endonuclease/exonuclease/phosphatase family metal-dependent hydrolase